MSRHSEGRSPVRYRPVVWAAGVAGSLMIASVASAAWHAAGSDDPGMDSPILQAAEVSSRATATEVTITVLTPKRQPPGVTYIVTRTTAHGDSVVCSGPAPLVCRDPVGAAGTAVSYTVVSSLAGHGQAAIAVDASTAPRPRPTRSTTSRNTAAPGRTSATSDGGGRDEPRSTTPTTRPDLTTSTSRTTESPSPSGSTSPASPSGSSPSPSGPSTSPTGSAGPSGSVGTATAQASSSTTVATSTPEGLVPPTVTTADDGR